MAAGSQYKRSVQQEGIYLYYLFGYTKQHCPAEHPFTGSDDTGKLSVLSTHDRRIHQHHHDSQSACQYGNVGMSDVSDTLISADFPEQE